MEAKTKRTSEIKAIDLARRAAAILEEKKGANLTILDVRGQSGITDFIVLATGASGPQLKAMYNDIQRGLKDEGMPVYRRAGIPEGGWLVLDYVDVVIHMLLPQTRAFYAIEDLWPDAPRLKQ